VTPESPALDPADSRSALLARLASATKAEQRAACDEALARWNSDRGLRGALLELLRGAPAHTRFAATWILFRAESPSLRLLPALLDALELADGDLRWEAAQMLAELGRLHGEVYPVLLHELRSHASALRRRMALYALRELAPERPETEQALLRAARDPSAELRRAALASCAKLAELSSSWLELGLEILAGESDPGLRALAPLVLARFAELHPGARPRVLAVLQELHAGSDPDLARVAVLARRRLAPVAEPGAEPAAKPGAQDQNQE
jgi:hypothetical protein